MRAAILLLPAVLSVGLYSATPQQAQTETPQKPEFKFAAGQKVYIYTWEVVEGPTNKIQTRLDDGENYDRAVKAFKKGGHFVLADRLSDADFVFLCLRFGKHGEKEIGVAVTPQDFAQNVNPINAVRTETNLDGLMAASLWNSQTRVHEAKRMGMEIATGGVYLGRYKVVAELVKAFHKEVL